MATSPAPARWALVTGASSGIGEAFARELAARGWSLVLTARRLDRLEALATQLRDAHGVAAHCVAADLADPDSPGRIHGYTQQHGVFVEMLVNNAGYGVPGTLVSQPWEKHRDFLRVLVDAMVELCWRYLPAMREQRRGRIVNVASLAGHVPGSAGHTLYAAAKAFAIKFSQSLALENRGRNLHVTAVCPGFTYSEFHDVTGARGIVSKMPGFMWMQSAEVARQGVDAVERGDVVYVNGRVNRFMKFLAKHLPDRWALRLVQRQSRNFRVVDAP